MIAWLINRLFYDLIGDPDAARENVAAALDEHLMWLEDRRRFDSRESDREIVL